MFIHLSPAGPQTSRAGPLAPLVDPQAPQAGPQTPLAGPQTHIAGPQTPMASPHNSPADPQTLLASPQIPSAAPQFGISPHSTGLCLLLGPLPKKEKNLDLTIKGICKRLQAMQVHGGSKGSEGKKRRD